MEERVVAVFIPIVFFLVSGLILIVYFYLRSKERQMLIEKNFDADSIKEFFETKRSGEPFRLLKFGIICFFFGLGLGLGLILEDSTYKDYWVPLLLFTVTGIGFVVANVVAHKLSNHS